MLFRSKPIRNLRPAEDYLKNQKRYAHLFGKNGRTDLLDRIQGIANKNIEEFKLVSEA